MPLQLSGLYESKPPISKAKMASITRSAMKAIKFYKHVVQSVEKFIQKCKCEYKITSYLRPAGISIHAKFAAATEWTTASRTARRRT